MAISALSYAQVNALCLEVQDYAERLQGIMNQLDNVLSQAKSSFDGDVSPEFYHKYQSLQLSFQVIQSNFLSYINDFHALIGAHENVDQQISADLAKKRIELLEEEK